MPHDQSPPDPYHSCLSWLEKRKGQGTASRHNHYKGTKTSPRERLPAPNPPAKPTGILITFGFTALDDFGVLSWAWDFIFIPVRWAGTFVSSSHIIKRVDVLSGSLLCAASPISLYFCLELTLIVSLHS